MMFLFKFHILCIWRPITVFSLISFFIFILPEFESVILYLHLSSFIMHVAA